MEGAASANEGAAFPEGPHGSKDAVEAAANQQPDEGLAAANEDAPLQGSANERKGSCGSANQDADTREVTNNSKEPPAANEDTACKASTNELTAHKASTNPTSGHKSPANQDTARPSTNQDKAPQLMTNQNASNRPNERQALPLHDPTNDLTPLAAAANQARDPWDWSLEEAWLRAPDEEGLAAWGAELESWEAEPDDEEEELDDWEVDPAGQGVELEHSKAWGVGLKAEGAELGNCVADPKGQGVELKSQGVGLKGQGEELKGQGVELGHCGTDPKSQGVELKPQGVGLKGQGVEFEHRGADPTTQGAELDAEWALPALPEPGHWLPSPDGAWSKLIVRPGRGLARPGPGSLCRVRLSVPRRVRSPWAPPPMSGRWQSVRLGSAEGPWSSLLDAALETMARAELAWLRPVGAAAAIALSVRLGRFTPAPPFWAVPPSVRWRPVAASGRARAAELLRAGRAEAAARALRRALCAAVAAAGPPPLPPALGEVKAELHAGLAEVQLRLGQAAAAAGNAGKALELRPNHLGARYARGVARAAMMDLEAAREDLVAVLRARPGHAGASRELGRVRDKARQRDTQLATRLGKMFA